MSQRLAIAIAAALLSGPAAATSLYVRGTAFFVTTDDGRTLTSRELVGARLTFDLAGSSAILAIESVGEDPVGGIAVLLHHFTIDTGDGPYEFCAPDPEGHRLGFPLELGDGSWILTCTSGAAGKCVRFGYRPWDRLDGVALAPYHSACVHLLRADYCGDDHPTTRDGTLVNIYDRLGIQRREVMPSLTFEAAFGPEGAVCIAHPRILDTNLDAEAARCPRLAAVPRGPACSEEGARALPEPLVFVDSVVPP